MGTSERLLDAAKLAMRALRNDATSAEQYEAWCVLKGAVNDIQHAAPVGRMGDEIAGIFEPRHDDCLRRLYFMLTGLERESIQRALAAIDLAKAARPPGSATAEMCSLIRRYLEQVDSGVAPDLGPLIGCKRMARFLAEHEAAGKDGAS